MSACKFPHLFSPITIRGNVYRNRIITGPTLFAHSVYMDDIKENVYRMCEIRAQGGAAEVTTGEICVNFEEASCAFVNFPVSLIPEGIDYTKYEGEQFEAFREYATRINRNGAISLLEFCHEGAEAMAVPPYSPYGPDEYDRGRGVHVKAMTPEIMDKICRDFQTSALYAKACGFKGILIHGAHGYLFQQFISPLTNHRTDEYGGSAENRARFPARILDSIREAVGEDFIIELRLSAQDGLEGGMVIDDTVEFCRLIDGKCDIIHVSNGLKSKSNSTYTFTDSYDMHGHNVQYAEKIKNVVCKSKVAVIGGINSPELGEEIIASGKADFIVLSRQALADPEFANKAENGNERLIRRCVRCFQCYPGAMETDDDPGFPKPPVPSEMGRCAINPKSDFTLYPETFALPEASRRVLIVGGGIAGMQAAITATERGHQVTLCERSSELGGILNFTRYDEDKVDLWNFRNTLIAELEYLSIDVRLNTEVTPALIESLRPEAVILAIGAHPAPCDIPGAETMLTALDVYDPDIRIGKKVVMVGGGLTACETALHLARHGHEVTVLGRNVRIAKESFCMHRTALKNELEKRRVKTVTSAECIAVENGAVRYRHEDAEILESADTVVCCLGMRSNDSSALKEACGDIPTWVIGDGETPGKVGDATKSGYLAAMQII